MKLTTLLLALFISHIVTAAPQEGDLAPNFELQASDDEIYTLAQFRGKQPVVISFFPKAFTGGWTAQCKALRDSDREIKNYDVAYFMASTDTLEDNTGFAEKNGATFPILADPNKTMCEAYGVLSARGYANRWTFYIDKAGVIQKIDKQVNVREAGKQLVENMDALNFQQET